MTATASDLLSAIAPEFDDSPTRQTMLDMAESRTNSEYFGSLRPQAVAYRAAHFLCSFNNTATAASGGVSGPVSAKSEGDLSVSFSKASTASKGAVAEDLATTAYGRALLSLTASRGIFAKVSGVPFVLSPGIRGGY